MKRCLQKLHEIVCGPEYHGKKIHLEVACVSGPYTTFIYEEDDINDREPTDVFAGNLTSTKKCAKYHDFYLHSIDCFETVKINQLYSIKLKVDTGDTCVMITMAIQNFQFQLTL